MWPVHYVFLATTLSFIHLTPVSCIFLTPAFHALHSPDPCCLCTMHSWPLQPWPLLSGPHTLLIPIFQALGVHEPAGSAGDKWLFSMCLLLSVRQESLTTSFCWTVMLENKLSISACSRWPHLWSMYSDQVWGNPSCQNTIEQEGTSLLPHCLCACRDLWVNFFVKSYGWMKKSQTHQDKELYLKK